MAVGYGIAQPKPPKRVKPKARTRIRAKAKPRAERRQIAAVRAQCVERDGVCRICEWPMNPDDWHADDLPFDDDWHSSPEWAHMHSRRRSKTRGMAAEVRHDTAHSLMLCTFHHQQYDAKRLIITALARKGADGPLKFRRAK